jgi:hypothetical protein
MRSTDSPHQREVHVACQISCGGRKNPATVALGGLGKANFPCFLGCFAKHTDPSNFKKSWVIRCRPFPHRLRIDCLRRFAPYALRLPGANHPVYYSLTWVDSHRTPHVYLGRFTPHTGHLLLEKGTSSDAASCETRARTALGQAHWVAIDGGK